MSNEAEILKDPRTREALAALGARLLRGEITREAARWEAKVIRFGLRREQAKTS